MEAGAGVKTAAATDFLEKVIGSTFQSEIFQGGGHEAVADIPDQEDGIIDDLLGAVDALELLGLILVDQIFVQVEAGSSQQGAGIIMKIGSNSVSFFLLETDRSIEQDLLFFFFQAFEFAVITDYFTLVEYYKPYNTYSKGKHT